MRAVALISALWLLALILFVMAVPVLAHDAPSRRHAPIDPAVNTLYFLR